MRRVILAGLVLATSPALAELPEYADTRANPTLALHWRNPDKGADHAHHCTGFYIGDGRIVTAAHCVHDEKKSAFFNAQYAIHDRNAHFYGYTDKVLFVDVRHDIAVVAGGNDREIRPARVLCTEPSKGQIIRVTGYPEERWYVETFGTLETGVGRVDSNSWPTYAYHNAAQDHGSSGGPVWDVDANAVIGIVVGWQYFTNTMVPTSLLCREYLSAIDDEKSVDSKRKGG